TWGNLTLTANWTPQTRLLSFVLNGTLEHPTSPTSIATQNHTVDALIVDATNFTTPTRNGYTFAGWYTTSTFVAGSIVDATTVMTPVDTTLYARWAEVPFTIEYAPSYTLISNPTQTSYTVSQLPMTLLVPTRVGYIFNGFTAEVNQSGSWIALPLESVGVPSIPVIIPIDTATPGVPPNGTWGNIRLTAHWTPETATPMPISINVVTSNGNPVNQITISFNHGLILQTVHNVSNATLNVNAILGNTVTVTATGHNSLTHIVTAADITNGVINITLVEAGSDFIVNVVNDIGQVLIGATIILNDTQVFVTSGASTSMSASEGNVLQVSAPEHLTVRRHISSVDIARGYLTVVLSRQITDDYDGDTPPEAGTPDPIRPPGGGQGNQNNQNNQNDDSQDTTRPQIAESLPPIASGYPDGMFRPNNSITRAEVASLLYEMFDSSGVAVNMSIFEDVLETAWYAQRVNTLASAGIITGYPDGRFMPNAPITRAEFTTLLVRFMGVEQSTINNNFSDLENTHWAFNFIMNAYSNGWIAGHLDGRFAPNANITRAEAVSMIVRATNRRDFERYPGNRRSFADVGIEHWAYEDIMLATEEVVKFRTTGF
ncbi:MAG: S-layer homology domain-containing protein, partial [Defluviitaleaceae bacterium]|nr:S-layer homology domain-containing protein [Defluviitaleaceae bacterium]